MEVLLSPFGLAFCALMYYLARRDGTLVFELSGYDYIVSEGLRIIDQDVCASRCLESEESRSMKHHAVSNLKQYLSEQLTESRFPRSKIYDLRKRFLKSIEQDRKRWSYDHSTVVQDAFRWLIENYDQNRKAW